MKYPVVIEKTQTGYSAYSQDVLECQLRTGAELVSYWQSEGLINSRPETKDSQEYARQIRHTAEHRQHT